MSSSLSLSSYSPPLLLLGLILPQFSLLNYFSCSRVFLTGGIWACWLVCQGQRLRNLCHRRSGYCKREIHVFYYNAEKYELDPETYIHLFSHIFMYYTHWTELQCKHVSLLDICCVPYSPFYHIVFSGKFYSFAGAYTTMPVLSCE